MDVLDRKPIMVVLSGRPSCPSVFEETANEVQLFPIKLFCLAQQCDSELGLLTSSCVGLSNEPEETVAQSLF
jgi:hypothetical protein